MSLAHRLGERITEARQRATLRPEVLARAAGMTPQELSRAESEGRLTSYQLEKVATATGQDMEFFLAAAMDPPVGMLLRSEDGSSPHTTEAIEWFERFIGRYEFVRGLQRE
jgi:transcriptional regulator with XRE-family HTH domain